MTEQEERRVYRAGLAHGAPTWFGIGAWGMVVGVAMVKTGLSLTQAVGMTLLVFAGSAQLAALPLMAAHAPLWILFLTALMVNLRFVIFSALLAPYFAHLPVRTRAWLGFLSGDVSVALFMQHGASLPSHRLQLAYLKSLIYPNWMAWQAGSLIGIFLGSQIPPAWGLGFAGTLALVCVMLPLIPNRRAAMGVAVSAGVSLLCYRWPYKLGLLCAVCAGMAAAMLWPEAESQARQEERT